MARDCRSGSVETTKQSSTPARPMEGKPIVCFLCKEVGHKSPQCPKKKEKIKRVLIKEDLIERLEENDVMAVVGSKRIPMTFDMGAPVSLVPVESVKPHEFTRATQKCKGILAPQEWSVGKGANITMTVGSERFNSRVLALPGEKLDWTAVLTVPTADRNLLMRINDITTAKNELSEAELHYLPPHIINREVQGALLVSEGEVVESDVKNTKEVVDTPVVASESPIPDNNVQKVRTVGEADDAEVEEQVLEAVVESPLVSEEADGET